MSATFTAEPLQPVIAFWGRQLNSSFETRFAPYNQLIQTLLDPQGEFAANHHGVNVLLARLEDLGQFGLTDAPSLSQNEANLAELLHVIRDASSRMSVPIFFCVCPASPQFLADPARAKFAKDAENLFATGLEDVPGAQFIRCEEITKRYPVEDPHDPHAERLGRIPYTELYFCSLGTALVRHAHALFAPPYKVIALDCDNTLWDGICGEDGPTGIVLDPPRRALQTFMLEQRDAGMLLAMASKNNEQDVLDTFEQNPQMPLQLRHFTAWRLNWQPKSENLAEIADELNIGIDSVMLVDDNPKECAEVEESLPEVLTLALPADIATAPHFLNHVWAFDHVVITEEDRNRNAYYAQTQQFGREAKRAANLNEFISSLQLETRFTPLTPERLPRVAQLTQRTNQFNFTTVRRTEAEIQALAADGYHCLTVDVTDRFGDYGLVGVIIYRPAGSALEIDTFLLSCRALGRGVEHRMLSHLGETAERIGLSTVRALLEKTKKNLPAQQFLASIHTSDNHSYEFATAALRNLQWKPTSLGTDQPKKARRPAQSRKFVEYARIAQTLSTPAQILEAMRREHRDPQAPVPEAMNEIEQRLAVIWSDLLQRPSIGIADNFFDLGGHSLLAVLLILRVKEAFGIELPIDDVYSATLTLGELARKIEMYQLSQMNPEEYAALLAEIESLSDEEVHRLLEQEERGESLT